MLFVALFIKSYNENTKILHNNILHKQIKYNVSIWYKTVLPLKIMYKGIKDKMDTFLYWCMKMIRSIYTVKSCSICSHINTSTKKKPTWNSGQSYFSPLCFLRLRYTFLLSWNFFLSLLANWWICWGSAQEYEWRLT